MGWQRVLLVWTLLLFGGFSGAAHGGLITFDELALDTTINGQTIDIVTFDFTVGGTSSSDAAVSNAGPGDTSLFTPPNLEGDRTGVLGLNFAQPVTSISYAFALFDFIAVPDGSTIQIFDSEDCADYQGFC